MRWRWIPEIFRLPLGIPPLLPLKATKWSHSDVRYPGAAGGSSERAAAPASLGDLCFLSLRTALVLGVQAAAILAELMLRLT